MEAYVVRVQGTGAVVGLISPEIKHGPENPETSFLIKEAFQVVPGPNPGDMQLASDLFFTDLVFNSKVVLQKKPLKEEQGLERAYNEGVQQTRMERAGIKMPTENVSQLKK